MDTVSIATKFIGVLLGSLIAFISWFIKGEMTDISQTLKTIQIDLETVKKESALTQQEMKFEMKYLRRDFEHIKNHVKNNGSK